jgi:hypothetical protein
MPFTQDTLAKHLKCSKSTLNRFIKAAGVKKRVKYFSGDDYPVYHPFTRQETEAILRAAWAHKGRREAIKMGIY